MNEQVNTIRAVVRSIDGEDAIVEVEQGGCGRCHEKGGCGGQHLTQMLCAGPKTYRVHNPGCMAIGETVTVAIAAGAIRHSANLAYVLPILSLIGGAVLGVQAGGNPGAMAGGVAGLILAWLYIRARMRPGAGNTEIRPYIVSRSHISS